MKIGKDNAKKHLAWYWISLAGTVAAILGGIVGGIVGASITVLGGWILLLISLASAVSGGMKGSDGGKVSPGSRIGAFFLALFIAFVALAINGSLVKSL